MIKAFWFVWVFFGLILEAIALGNTSPNDTLTGVIVQTLPGWAAYSVLGWLGWHFMVSYLNGKDER